MRVYLVQHGESRPEEEDPQRRLTDEGVRNVQNVARFLRPLGLKLETIWHSGKHRAQQTAEILVGAVSASQGMLQRNDLAPKDPVAPVKQAIEQSAGDLMIVGHLPFLGKLAALLAADNEETEIVACAKPRSSAAVKNFMSFSYGRELFGRLANIAPEIPPLQSKANEAGPQTRRDLLSEREGCVKWKPEASPG